MPAEFRPYDPNFVEVARALGNVLARVDPAIEVEHIGSTSVPGCGGKGVIDLAVLYPDGHSEQTKAVLDQLGFQRQTGRELFPESRPMRVGSIEYDRKAFRIHAHVIALGSAEHQELVCFRETLRARPELRSQYEQRKLAILASGITDPVDYCHAKSGYIQDVLQAVRGQPLAPP
jgi:GrpB-like predicted nucleotidyltransferase (UPF0157 family)